MYEVAGRAQPLAHGLALALVVLGFDLTNGTRLAAAWPTISNPRAIAVSQSWEAGRADPSGALLASWQAPTLPAVVAGCACVDKNVNCSRWAKDRQCQARKEKEKDKERATIVEEKDTLQGIAPQEREKVKVDGEARQEK